MGRRRRQVDRRLHRARLAEPECRIDVRPLRGPGVARWDLAPCVAGAVLAVAAVVVVAVVAVGAAGLRRRRRASTTDHERQQPDSFHAPMLPAVLAPAGATRLSWHLGGRAASGRAPLGPFSRSSRAAQHEDHPDGEEDEPREVSAAELFAEDESRDEERPESLQSAHVEGRHLRSALASVTRKPRSQDPEVGKPGHGHETSRSEDHGRDQVHPGRKPMGCARSRGPRQARSRLARYPLKRMGQERPRSLLDRRAFLAMAGAVPLASTSCSKRVSPPPAANAEAAPVTLAPANVGVIRVASVKTAVEGNVLPELIADFEKASSYKVELAPGEAVYTSAREGKADLVISHYGHREAEDFVLEGLGEWPRTVFSNQMALFGPPADPARVRGLEDAGEAFRRIAATKSTFVLNDIDGVRYLTESSSGTWRGRPDRTGLVPRRGPPQGRSHRARVGDGRVLLLGADALPAAEWSGATEARTARSGGPTPSAPPRLGHREAGEGAGRQR